MKTELLIISLSFLFTAACERQTTPPMQNNANVKADLVQLDGCQRGNLSKRSEEDSCFVWSFKGHDLTVNFCVTANCCPDSDRFMLDYNIEDNLIQVTVIDTAGNLCRCICPYLIHTEFTELPLDEYIYKVDYNNQIIYNRQVSR